MKVRTALIISSAYLLAGGAPAGAQQMVSVGKSLAHECYMSARAANEPQAGIAVCDQSLQFENLTVRDRAATYDNRGVLKNALGETDSALDDFNHSIRINELLGDAYVNRGSILIKQQQYDTALADINKGLGLGMTLPHIGYYDRAVAEQLMGRYREAYYDYKHVLEIDPNFTRATEMLKDFTVTHTPASADNPS